jgi:hypothetical protein
LMEPFSNLKETIQCPCGIEPAHYGTSLKRNGHTRNCPRAQCKSCMGKHSRRAGADAQRRARKGLGIPDTKHAGRQGNEENWLGTVRVEVKSGGIAKPAWTVYLRSEVQSEQNRPVGDNRPFVAVFDAGSDRLISIRESKLREVVAALAEMWGWM